MFASGPNTTNNIYIFFCQTGVFFYSLSRKCVPLQYQQHRTMKNRWGTVQFFLNTNQDNIYTHTEIIIIISHPGAQWSHLT